MSSFMEAVGISHENMQTTMAAYRHANNIYEDLNILCMSEGIQIIHKNIFGIVSQHFSCSSQANPRQWGVFWRACEWILSTSLKRKEQANQSKHVLSDHPLIKYFHHDKGDFFQDDNAPQEKQVSEWFDVNHTAFAVARSQPIQTPTGDFGTFSAAIIQTPNEGEGRLLFISMVSKFILSFLINERYSSLIDSLCQERRRY